MWEREEGSQWTWLNVPWIKHHLACEDLYPSHIWYLQRHWWLLENKHNKPDDQVLLTSFLFLPQFSAITVRAWIYPQTDVCTVLFLLLSGVRLDVQMYSITGRSTEDTGRVHKKKKLKVYRQPHKIYIMRTLLMQKSIILAYINLDPVSCWFLKFEVKHFVKAVMSKKKKDYWWPGL